MLGKHDKMPSTREAFREYFERGIWTNINKKPYIHMRIAHNAELEEFQEEKTKEVLKNKDMFLIKEIIQAEQICKVGCFMGSHPGTFDSQNWMDAHQMMNLLENNADSWCRIRKQYFLIHLKEFLYSIIQIAAVLFLFFLARPTSA